MDNNETLAPFRAIFEAIYRRAGADALETGWSAFLAAIASESDMDLTTQMIHVLFDVLEEDTDSSLPLFDLDHKTADTDLTFIANNVLRGIGIEPDFAWTFYDPHGAEAQMGLHALNSWLRPKGYAVLNIETGGDGYLCTVVERDDLTKVVATSKTIRFSDSPNRPVVYEVPEQWAIDPSPDRPAVWNSPLFVLWWSPPAVPGQRAKWSDTFSDARYSIVGSEAELAQLKLQYREENPSHEVRVIERPSLKVRDGAPETWFVVAADKVKSPHLTWSGSGQFVAARTGNERTLTNDLSDAMAWRSYATAGGSHEFQTVYTLEKARQLAPMPIKPEGESWRKFWTRRPQ